MAEPIPCPSCSKPLPIPPNAEGKNVKCPGCGAALHVGADAGALVLELREAKPVPRRASQRTTGGRVKHKVRGQLDHDAEPAGSMPPTVIAMLALAGMSTVFLGLAAKYLVDQRNKDLEDFVPQIFMATEDGILFTPLTLIYLIAGMGIYVTGIIGVAKGRRWGAHVLVSIAVVAIALCLLIFRGGPLNWPVRIQLFFVGQPLILLLRWIPPAPAWLTAKANDRAVAAADRRRGQRKDA